MVAGENNVNDVKYPQLLLSAKVGGELKKLKRRATACVL